MRSFRSESVRGTEALGEALGALLEAGAVVALRGDLGAGKTAFSRGLARGLGVVDPITSPTFTLMQEHQGRVPFFHFDAWMAGREANFLAGGGADYFGGEGVCAIEWAERIEAYLPDERIEVSLSHAGPELRRLELRALGSDPALRRLVAALRPAHDREIVEEGAERADCEQIRSVDEPPGAGSVDGGA